MRKIVLLFAIVTALGSYVNSQTTLSWRFANYEVVNAGAQLQFDVEVMANNATTYHRDLQVYFDYNTAGFGSSVATGITVTPLSLMVTHYSIVNTADNTTSKIAIITEADNEMDELGGATYFNLMPNAFTGLFQVTMDITDNAATAGISFDEALMNGGQYYQSTTAIEPVKYIDPSIFDNDLFLNKLSTVFGNITYANASNTPLSEITAKLMDGVVEVALGVSMANGDYYISSIDDGSYTLENETTKAWGGLNGLDVILTKRFIANLWSFSPLQMIAADVNEGGVPDGLDIIMMKRKLGSLSTPAWNAPDYVFEPQSVTVVSGIGNNDYQGLCSGDVNGSYTPPAK